MSTFAGQPCLAALQVDWRGHRVRMMWSVTTRAPPSNPRLWLDHGSAWVTWLKCEQQQSACTALAHHELLVLTCCRRACGRTCKVCKTKEHRSLQRRELFTNGFDSALLRATSECTGKVPKADIGECRCGVFPEFWTSDGGNPVELYPAAARIRLCERTHHLRHRKSQDSPRRRSV